MKIKNLIKVLFILVLAGIIVLIVSCTKTMVDYSQMVSRKSLKIISEHNAYALVVENEDYELPTYAVYKNVNYNNYQKVFDLRVTNDIWSGLVCWTDDRLFIFGFTIASYDLTNGQIIDEGDFRLSNADTGMIGRVLGIYDNYIYYEYANREDSYGKTSLDFKEVIPITKKDLPKKLEKQLELRTKKKNHLGFYWR